MVIGIDAREAAGKPAGKGRYVQQMLKHLPASAPEDRFLCYIGSEVPDLTLRKNAEWCEISGAGLKWHRNVASAAGKECDVYFSTTSYVTPQFLKIPFVMTVYDLVTFKGFAVPQKRARLIERSTLSRAVKRARRVVSISQSTADDLVSMLPGARGKVSVTTLAADDRFGPRPTEEIVRIRKAYALPESYVLSAGTIEPRKNIARLLEAYSSLPADLRKEHGLVLAGKRGWQTDEIFQTLKRVRQTIPVRYLDFVSDDDLAVLYAGATLFCYPSLYEGFGLPILEAMQSEVPVLCSNASSLPEVGGDAVAYVDPLSVSDIASGMAEALQDTDRRHRLASAGRKRAELFSWGKTARQTIGVLHET